MKTPKTFEAGIDRLDEILAQLSDEATPLADAVKLYAEAASLIASCTAVLDGAKLKIEEIDEVLKKAPAKPLEPSEQEEGA